MSGSRSLLYLKNPLNYSSPSSNNFVVNPFTKVINTEEEENDSNYILPKIEIDTTAELTNKNNVKIFLQSILDTDDIKNVYKELVKFINQQPKPSVQLENLFLKKNAFEQYFGTIRLLIIQHRFNISIIIKENKNLSNICTEIINEIDDSKISYDVSKIKYFREFLVLNTLRPTDATIDSILDIYKILIENKQKKLADNNVKFNNIKTNLEELGEKIDYNNFNNFVAGSISSSASSWTF